MAYMVDLVEHSVKDHPVSGSMLEEMFAYSAMREFEDKQGYKFTVGIKEGFTME